MGRLQPVIVAAAVLGALCSPAAAQDGGVVKPNSPAGTEYQLPLERARSEANGGNQPDAGTRAGQSEGSIGGVQSPPLFGAGIKRTSRRRGSSAGGGADQSSDSGKAPEGQNAAGAVRSNPAVAQVDNSSGRLRGLGIGFGILLAGGVLGLALKRTHTTRGS